MRCSCGGGETAVLCGPRTEGGVAGFGRRCCGTTGQRFYLNYDPALALVAVRSPKVLEGPLREETRFTREALAGLDRVGERRAGLGSADAEPTAARRRKSERVGVEMADWAQARREGLIERGDGNRLRKDQAARAALSGGLRRAERRDEGAQRAGPRLRKRRGCTRMRETTYSVGTEGWRKVGTFNQ